MPAKQRIPGDEEDEEEEDLEEEAEADKFTCRMCGKVRDTDEGDDTIDVCDDCLEGYDMNKFWNDFEKGKIPENELKTISLEPYLKKKAAKKTAKKTAKKAAKKAATSG